MTQAQVQADEFLDMTAFYLAVSAVDQILSDLTADPAAHAGVDAEKLRQQREEADAVLRRIAPMVDAGMDSILRSAAEKSKLRVKGLLNAALRGSALANYSTRARFLMFILPRMKSRANVLRDVFGEDASKAIRIAQASETESPAARLFQIAEVRSATGGRLSFLQRWIQEATEACGNPVSEIQKLVTDVAATDAILDKVMRNNRKLDALDPTDPQAAAISEENAKLMEKASSVVANSADPTAIKAHAAAKLNADDARKYATRVSANLKMTPEQEDAMLVRGRAIIAAGAGSGKTRVLAGKVIHHIQDQKLSLSNIMAVSFTRKSALELADRIADYAKDMGIMLPPTTADAWSGIGTTHSIGRAILMKAGYTVSGDEQDDRTGPITGSTLTNIVKVAIMQVKMRGMGGMTPPISADAMTFFPNLPSSTPEIEEGSKGDPAVENASPIDNPSSGSSPLSSFLADQAMLKNLLDGALDTLRDIVKAMPEVRVSFSERSGWSIAELRGPGIYRFGDLIKNIHVPGAKGGFSFKPADVRYKSPDRYAAFSQKIKFNQREIEKLIREGLGINQAERGIQALEVLKTKDPQSFTANELEILEGIITQPVVAAGLTQRGVLVSKTAKQADEKNAMVSEEGIESVSSKRTKRLVENEKGPLYYWTRYPANQWFNIGASENDFKDEDPRTGKLKPIPISEFTRFISFNKNSLSAPGALFSTGEKVEDRGFGDDEDAVELETARQMNKRRKTRARIFAAVYGAYEWLKGKAYPGRFDFDDQLVQSTRMLIEKPNVLQSFQKQYKCVMVDEAQDLNKCVHGDTLLQTPAGQIAVRDVAVGDLVLSFENGRVLFNRITQKVRSSWDRGYRIHLRSGETLTMSPDHRIYATPLNQCEEGQMALYLMYRKGMGFRVGTSNKLFQPEESSVGRAAQERADCAWILEVGDRDEMLYKEQVLSLKYAIPTYVFEGSSRGCDQERIDRIFQEFGENGRSLLAEYDLDFRYPHWTAFANDRGRITRRVVNLCAHRGKGQKKVQRGSFVSMNWTTGDFDLDVPVYTVKGGRKMVGVLTSKYEDGLRIAKHVAERSGAYLTESLCIDDTHMPLITASGLLPGMQVPVWRGGVDAKVSDLLPIEAYRTLAMKFEISAEGLDGCSENVKRRLHHLIRQAQIQKGLTDVLPPIEEAAIELVKIEAVEVVQGGDFWDISVENAHNFFGNGILSHNCQHLMFGLLAGYLDPSTLKPRADGRMSADTFCLIGDDKQCVDKNAMISTPNGLCRLGDLKPGDAVLSYRNGEIVPQIVRYVVPSSWERGIRVTTESGRKLLMSPNHRLWATEPRTQDDQHIVYLMYRSDMGFRIGTTNKGKVGPEGDYLNSFEGRAFLEKAERLWVLDICESREAALLEETRISLRYGIPTAVFNGEHHGMNDERIVALFAEFGRNGVKLLESCHLSFDHPHWMSQSYSKHGCERHTVNLLAHSHKGTQVSMEWSGSKFDDVLADVQVSAADNRRRLHRYFKSYREGLAFAEKVARVTRAAISHRLAADEGPLRELTASALFVGMSVLVLDGENVTLDPITHIEEVPGEFIDIDVMDASNFFAEGILTHNSIYEFRAASPDRFIEKSDLVPNSEGFTTKLLDTNFRSGSAIVEAANNLIAHNSKQIPMVCKTDPGRGEGSITRAEVKTLEDGAALMVKNIVTARKEAEQFGNTKDFYKQYGVAVRTNKQVYAFAMKLLEAGIPFRSKKNPLRGPAIEPIIGIFMTLSQDRDTRNKGVLTAMKAPDFGMSADTVAKKLQALKVVDYFEFLSNPKNASKVYTYYDRRLGYEVPNSHMTPKVEAYAKYLTEIKKIGEKDGAAALISFALNYTNPDNETFVDSLVASLENDPEAMEEIRQKAAETEDGKITPQMLSEYALSPVQPLMTAADRFPAAQQFTDYIHKLTNLNRQHGKKDDDVDADAVQIDTVHGWKGLEVSKLYVPMWDGGFPHARSSGDPKMMESEHRLAYVALTRGRDQVTVLEPQTVNGREVNPSQFVYEACIPITGTSSADDVPSDETVEGKTAASFEAYLKTAKVSDFILPLPAEKAMIEGPFEILPLEGWEDKRKVPPPQDEELADLEAMWGSFVSEEN